MKNRRNKILAGIIMICALMLGGCTVPMMQVDKENAETDEQEADLIVVGFSQPGAESAWRVALTESVKEYFTEENGYKLIYKDGQSKQDNQIKDIRTFIQQGVDYIILSPIVETGWDQVLEEAKAADIPVIICDRGVTVSNESLYTAYAGSNFRQEGTTAVECIEKLLRERGMDVKSVNTDTISEEGVVSVDAEVSEEAEESEEKPESEDGMESEEETADADEEQDGEETAEETSDDPDSAESINPDDFNIVHIQGTIGSSAQIGRTKALEEAVASHEGWNIIAQETGDFTKGKAREAMTQILEEIDGHEIDMVYCENDEEAAGVMAALNEAGLTYGTDGKIIIVSFDGTNQGLTMCMDGQINIEVECNPLQGSYLYNIVSELEAGERVPKLAYIDEGYFTPDMLTQEFIDSRKY